MSVVPTTTTTTTTTTTAACTTIPRPELSAEEHLLLFLISCRYDTKTTNRRGVREAMCSLPSPLSHHFTSHTASLHTYTEVHNLSPLFPFVRQVVPSLQALFQLSRADLETQIIHPAGALPEQWAALSEALPQFKDPKERYFTPRAPTSQISDSASSSQVQRLDGDNSRSTEKRSSSLLLITPSTIDPTIPVVRGPLPRRPSFILGVAPSLASVPTTSDILVLPSKDPTSQKASTKGGFPERGLGVGRELICKRCNPQAHSDALTEWALDQEVTSKADHHQHHLRGPHVQQDAHQSPPVTNCFDTTKRSQFILHGSITSECATPVKPSPLPTPHTPGGHVLEGARSTTSVRRQYTLRVAGGDDESLMTPHQKQRQEGGGLSGRRFSSGKRDGSGIATSPTMLQPHVPPPGSHEIGGSVAAQEEPAQPPAEPSRGRLTLEQRKIIDDARKTKAIETERVRRQCEEFFSRPFDPLSMAYSRQLQLDPSELTYFIEAYAREVTVVVPKKSRKKAALGSDVRGGSRGPGRHRSSVKKDPEDNNSPTTSRRNTGYLSNTRQLKEYAAFSGAGRAAMVVDSGKGGFPYERDTTSYLEHRIELPRFEALMEAACVPLGTTTRARLWKLLLTQTQHTLPLKQRRRCRTVSSNKFLHLLVSPASRSDPGAALQENPAQPPAEASSQNPAAAHPKGFHPTGGVSAHEVLTAIFHTFASNGLLIHEELAHRDSMFIPVEQHRMFMQMFSQRPIGVGHNYGSRGAGASSSSTAGDNSSVGLGDINLTSGGGAPYLSILTFEDFCRALETDPFHTTVDGSRVHWSVVFFDQWVSTLVKSRFFRQAEENMYNPPAKKKTKKKAATLKETQQSW